LAIKDDLVILVSCFRKAEEQKTIQDIRVTKKQKHERVEREVPVQPMKSSGSGDKVIVRLECFAVILIIRISGTQSIAEENAAY
jgi:hypothetical protein